MITSARSRSDDKISTSMAFCDFEVHE
jgi:hypothetical protein